MAQYRASIQGNRGTASRLGHKADGIVADVNGWNSGVNVFGHYDGDDIGDVFDITMTPGSGGNGQQMKIGSVHIVDGKPVFRASIN